jgi:uncharacterized protein YndB with AHSA1/START domain
VAEIVVAVDVDAPVETTWAAVTDWDRQGEWMLGTTVRAVTGGPSAEGTRLEARTGAGPLAVVDQMRITDWEPPHRCQVAHLGRVVRGSAAFEVEPLTGGRSRFIWSEWLDLPLGLAGQYGFLLGRPLFEAGLRLSLQKFARWAVTYPAG